MIVNKIKKESNDFPSLLKEINDVPKELYVLGNVNNLRKKCITIVGSRDCTEKGKVLARKIAYKFAKKGYVIVSGLAKGIDMFAHIGALDANGLTIAIVAHGLDRIYPKENRELAVRIIKNNGTIITEHKPFSEFLPENFVCRNRILSGISEKVILVEVKKKSGALITASFALEENREIYVVSRDVSDYTIGGINLLKSGAKLL